MSVIELRRLWALHEADSGLLQIKAQVQGLDIGQREAEEIKSIEEADEPVGGSFKTLKSELKDLEIQEKDLIAKQKKINDLLMSGKATSPKEILGYEKEQEGLKKSLSQIEDRMLELMDELPQIEPGALETDSKIEVLKSVIAKKRKAAAVKQAQLQADFKALAANRPELVKEVNPGLLAKYEATRQKRAGIGMVRISHTHNCSVCGMKVAEKTVDSVKEGNINLCESCQRILYWTDGVS